MKEVYLVIWFLTAQGEMTIVDGWHPRAQPSYEVCEQRKEYWINYADEQLVPFEENVREDIVGYIAYCK